MKKSTRFEVFKRDSFTCQYCGRSAPDVVLRCDHIEPRAKGGSDDILNLITSCFDCNAGKSDRRLSDDSVVAKQKKQLKLLQERREQIAMMMEWQKSLLTIEQDAIEALAQFWRRLAPGFVVSEHGRQDLARWVRKYSLPEVMEAMKTSASQYIELQDDGVKVTADSWDKAFLYIPRICNVNKLTVTKPYLRDLFYTRGILRKRFGRIDERYVMPLMERVIAVGVNVETIKDKARTAYSWANFRDCLELTLEEYGDGED